MSPGHVLDQHTPFAADVSDEAGPNTTGATAGQDHETDLLDPWTPGPRKRTTHPDHQACEHGMAVTDPAHADGLQPNLANPDAAGHTRAVGLPGKGVSGSHGCSGSTGVGEAVGVGVFCRSPFWWLCIVCVVTRLNVYLPDELAAQAKEARLNLSAVTQEAVRRTLAARSTDSWLSSTLRTASIGAVTHDRALEALDEIRDEPPTRHG